MVPTNNCDEMRYELHALGDSAVVVEFGHDIDIEIHNKVQSLAAALDESAFPGFVEYVPAFTTVTVYYDPWQVYQQSNAPLNKADALSPYEQVCSWLQRLISGIEPSLKDNGRIVEIPVVYGGEFGPDLLKVAGINGFTEEEVISIHAQGRYRVFMIGFAPGFPYLGGMSGQIAIPRRETPRLSIPSGSVGIGGNQTGIYPLEAPGGWHLIGRTPMALFTPHATPPSLLRSGDTVRFFPISVSEYHAWKERSP